MRLTALPYATYFAIVFLLDSFGSAGQMQSITLLGNVIAAVFGAWMAVGWHRFILKGEYPNSWIPNVKWRSVRGYILTLSLLAVVSTLSALPFVFIASIGGPSLPLPTTISFFMIPFLVGLFFFGFGLVLPAVALGKPLTFKDSWQVTSSISGGILLLIFLYTLFTGGLTAIGAVMPLGPVNIAWDFGAGWVQVMLSVSVLTTLYGSLVEKRELL